MLRNCIYFLLLFSHCDAQITFQKGFGETTSDIGLSIDLTHDGGYLVAGQSAPVLDSSHVCLVKYDQSGNVMWNRTYYFLLPGLSSPNQSASCVKETFDFGFIVTGHASSVYGTDLFLIRTDSLGDTLWTRTYYTYWRGESGSSVKQTSDSGFIVTGTTVDSATHSEKLSLIKFDSFGNIIWNKSFDVSNGDGSGSMVLETANGDLIIAGTVDDSTFATSIFVMKTDSNGNIVWNKIYNDGSYFNSSSSIIQTNDNGLLVVGRNGNGEGLVLKLDSFGNSMWSRTFVVGVQFATLSSVIQTLDNGFIVLGSQGFVPVNGGDSTYVSLIKIDSLGNIQWNKIYGDGSDYGWDLKQAIDSGLVITGHTNSLSNTGVSDIFLIKTDSNGNSGCNELIPQITVDSPNTFSFSPSTNVDFPNIIAGHPYVIVSNMGSEITFCSSVAIRDIFKQNLSGFSCYYNPSSNSLVFSFYAAKSQSAYLQFFDVFGRLLLFQSIPVEVGFNSHQLQARKSIVGVYFARLVTERGDVVKKLLIE